MLQAATAPTIPAKPETCKIFEAIVKHVGWVSIPQNAFLDCNARSSGVGILTCASCSIQFSFTARTVGTPPLNNVPKELIDTKYKAAVQKQYLSK